MSTGVQEQVSQICSDLYKKGEKISVRAVLSLIPDVSSTSTVHKYVKAWRDELQANQQTLIERLGFSEKFIQSFLEEFSRFNTEAEKRWRETAEQSKEQAREAIDDLERIEGKYHKQQALSAQNQKTIRQLEDEARENKKSQQIIETELRKRIAQLEADKSTLAENNETLRTEVAKSQLKVENNENYVKEIKENQGQMARELQSANEQIATQAATIAKLETNTERDVQQIEDFRANAIDYRRLMEESEKRADKLEEANRQLEISVTAIKKESTVSLSTLQSKLEAASKEIADKDRRLAQLENVVDTLTSKTKE